MDHSGKNIITIDDIGRKVLPRCRKTIVTRRKEKKKKNVARNYMEAEIP